MATRPRRLLAILHADLAGYVRLMEGSEDQTVDRLQTVRAEIWRPAIEAGGGSVVNIEGDSVLAAFVSPNAALAAAIDIQERLAAFNAMLEEDQRLMYRIGLHLGVVIVDEKTRSIFGDGVNLAARIQAMAEPGGIAVSRALRDVVEASAECDFTDGGEHWAKNVSRPLHIYHVRSRSDGSLPAAASRVPPATRIARRSSALARAARQGSSARLTMRGPALWGAVAGVALLFAGGGYFAYQAHMPATVSSVALSLSVEQLEQALAERRKADALAHEKRQLEETARRRVAVEGEATRQAEADLERARQARQKAEDDLAKLRADIEGRRKRDGGEREHAATALRRAAEEAAQRRAEDEAAGLRRAEEEATRKAAADAEAKRQADDALAKAAAERQRAEREALEKADVEQAALRRAAEQAQRKTAGAESRRQAEEKERADAASAALAKQKEESEAAEKGLRLDQAARARLQVALTSLGFDARGSDGVFGPRTREMIAAWQKARRVASTGFLTPAQQQALLREGAAAVTKHDERRESEDEAKVRTAVSELAPSFPPLLPAALSSPVGSALAAPYDGAYSGPASPGNVPPRLQASLQVANGRGVGMLASPGCQDSRFTVSVSPTGSVNGTVYFNCVAILGSTTIAAGDFAITGEYSRKGFELTFRSQRSTFSLRLAPTGATVALASPTGAPGEAAAASRHDLKTMEDGQARPAAFPVSASLPPGGGSSAGIDLIGSYGGAAIPDSFVGPAPRVQVSLHVTNGQGVGSLAAPGCQQSRFVVFVSRAGAISGHVEFNCTVAVSNVTTIPAGRFEISGKHRGREIQLGFRSPRTSFSARLTADSTVVPIVPAPSSAPADGLWRGAYDCGAAVGMTGHRTPPFTIPLHLRVSNGAAIWKGGNTGVTDGDTFEIRMHVSGNSVSVTRNHMGLSAGTTVQSTLAGHYDGNGMKAAGREQGHGFRQCTFALTRA